MHSGRFILALQSCNTTMIIVIFLCLFFFQYAHSIDYTYACGWFIITSASRPYVCLSVCLSVGLLTLHQSSGEHSSVFCLKLLTCNNPLSFGMIRITIWIARWFAVSDWLPSSLYISVFVLVV